MLKELAQRSQATPRPAPPIAAPRNWPKDTANSGEGTRTDLGDGPEGTDTGGDKDADETR